ncbi:MAG: hypothetical protein ACJA06_000045 [Halocynthiibacter sp.]|jgi:uncharacterized protein (TIGR02646 family)
MIFVARGKTPDSLKLDDPTSAGARELAAARAFNEPPPGTFYKAYKRPDVREALRDLFHGKCAYCEGTIAGTSDTDIEHYRPKGAVKEAEEVGFDHPGYWWLAMDYTNLVLSCSHCNQGRKQLIIDPDWSADEIEDAFENGEMVLRGKLHSFPVAHQSWVTTPDENISLEEPLIIDPTITDPNDHLEFLIDGPLVTVIAKQGSEIGARTIDVLGLNRRRLTEERLQKALLLRNMRDKIRKRIRRLDDADDQTAQFLKDDLLEDIQSFQLHCSVAQPFSAIGTQLLTALIHELQEAIS